MTPSTSRPHWPGLDGLRGLAVVAVLAYHGGVPGFGAGFLGVDVFFVLSGFLITRLLLGEGAAAGRIALRGFWARRARRLLPALVLVVGFVLIAARALVPPGDLGPLRGDVLGTLAYVANWRFILSGQGYFGQMSAPSPLLHTWSLGLEEQFYLVWPVVVALALRARRPRVSLAWTGALAATASALEMGVLEHLGYPSTRLYFGTDTHCQPLMVGVLLAAVLPIDPATRSRPWRVGGPSALVALAASVVLIDPASPWLFQGGFLAVAALTALLMASVLRDPDGPVGRALSWRPLRWVGLISYELYLWHWPLDLLITPQRVGISGPALFVLRTAAAVAAAAGTYYLVSRPVRFGLRRRWALGGLAVWCAAALAAFTGAGGIVAASPAGAVTSVRSGPGGDSGRAGSPEAAGPEGPDPGIVFFGDSVAYTLAAGLYQVQSAYGVRIDNLASVGCGVMGTPTVRYLGVVERHPGACPGPAQWRAQVAGARPAEVALLVGRWETTDQLIDGTWQHIGQPFFDRRLRLSLAAAYAAMTSSGARLVLLSAPCYSGPDQPDGSAWPENDPGRVAAFNRMLRQLAAQHPGTVTYLDFEGLVCPGNRFAYTVGGVDVRQPDGVHITPAGAALVARRLLPQLRALASNA